MTELPQAWKPRRAADYRYCPRCAGPLSGCWVHVQNMRNGRQVDQRRRRFFCPVCKIGVRVEKSPHPGARR